MPLSDALALLVVYTLAAGAAIDAWRNGSIFAGWRARLESEADRFPRLAELAECSFCLSYQAPFWLMVLFHGPGYLSPWLMALRVVPFALACARLGWLLNGVLPDNLKYHRKGTP